MSRSKRKLVFGSRAAYAEWLKEKRKAYGDNMLDWPEPARYQVLHAQIRPPHPYSNTGVSNGQTGNLMVGGRKNG